MRKPQSRAQHVAHLIVKEGELKVKLISGALKRAFWRSKKCGNCFLLIYFYCAVSFSQNSECVLVQLELSQIKLLTLKFGLKVFCTGIFHKKKRENKTQ